MKKNYILIGMFLSLGFGAFAQDKHCGHTEAMNSVYASNPEIKKQHEIAEEKLSKLDEEAFQKGYKGGYKLEGQQNSPSASGIVYTIPIVFHILHQGGAENITNAQVYDAVRILNDDYRKLNSDTSAIVNDFKALAGDAEIEFRLATIDPNGNCTNGIIRHSDPNTNWDNTSANSNGWNNYVYTGTTAGKWNPTKYLNVYVVSTIVSGAAGYTYKPGTWSAGDKRDAIVILHDYVGSIGTGQVGRSRALTHEIGHWLNLDHVWGGTNQPGVSCGNDNVSDTPVTKGWTSCVLSTANQVCNAGVTENVQNYMEYAYCSNMFTNGQITRMRNAITSGTSNRSNLWSATNLTNTGVTTPLVCAPSADFKANKYFVCTTGNVQFSDSTTNTQITSWNWSFPGGTPATSTDSMPIVTYNTPGVYAVTYTATNSAGSDIVTKSNYINVLSNTATYQNAFTEGFETSTIPGADWSTQNYGGGVDWVITSSAASTGTMSAMVDNFNNNAGEVENLLSPSFNLNNIYVTSPPVTMTFKLAHRRKTTTSSDKLQVFSSTNCGQTWQQRYSKSGASLATSTTTSATAWTPSSASDWRTETVNVVAVSNQTNVWFKFVLTSDANGSSNNLFIDDINIQGTTAVGIDETANQLNLNIFPNPSNGLINVSFELVESQDVKISMSNTIGETIEVITQGKMNAGTYQFKTSNQQQLPAGLYFIHVQLNGKTFTHKVIVE